MQLDRELQLFDFDLSYLINPRLSIVAGVRQHDLEQDGGVGFGSENASSEWDISTQTLEAGLEVAVAEGFTLGVGLREENREADWTIAEGGAPNTHAEEDRPHRLLPDCGVGAEPDRAPQRTVRGQLL